MLTLHLSDEVIIRCHLVIGDATESLNHPAWAHRDRARLGSQSSGSDNQCIVDIANSLSDISCLFLPLSMENKWRKFCHVKKIKNLMEQKPEPTNSKLLKVVSICSDG